jgi:rod shape-determining protein MreD
LGALIQASVLTELPFLPIKPNLLLLLVLSCAVTSNLRDAFVWAFAGGLLLDYFTGTPLGTSSLVLILVLLAVGASEINVFRRGLIMSILFAFPASILYSLLILACYRVFGYQIDLLQVIIRTVLPGAVINVIVMPLIYYLIRGINKVTGRIQQGAY